MTVQDVTSRFDELEKSLNGLTGEIAKHIAELATAMEWEKVNDQTEYVRRVNVLTSKVTALKQEWITLNQPSDEEQEVSEELPVAERTTWEIDGNNIRVVTKGGKSEYSNVIPIPLFKELAYATARLIREKQSIKTTDVFNLMKDRIVEGTDYKKAPRLPVYVTFKVLVKQGVLKNLDSNSHRFEFVTNEDALHQFLQTLG